jgi:hypothetical protein
VASKPLVTLEEERELHFVHNLNFSNLFFSFLPRPAECSPERRNPPRVKGKDRKKVRGRKEEDESFV